MTAGETPDAGPRHHLRASGIGRQTGFLLRQAEAAVWADLTARLRPFGLRPAQFAALRIVRESPGCRQQEIGDALGIQRPNLVALVEALRRRRLVTVARNPADRRSYALTLTAAGQALLADADRAHAVHESRVAAALAPADATALAATLERLARLEAPLPVAG